MTAVHAVHIDKLEGSCKPHQHLIDSPAVNKTTHAGAMAAAVAAGMEEIVTTEEGTRLFLLGPYICVH